MAYTVINMNKTRNNIKSCFHDIIIESFAGDAVDYIDNQIDFDNDEFCYDDMEYEAAEFIKNWINSRRECKYGSMIAYYMGAFYRGFNMDKDIKKFAADIVSCIHLEEVE